MTIQLYENILARLREIISGTEFENHVFSVGGCERDRILGNEIKDIDLVVDIKNGGIRLANFLKDNDFTKGSVVVYEHFGTAMFTLKDFPTVELEAVQTRSECYHDMESRNPDTVFGTIEEDCHRRDFTINAIYRNVTTGEVLDLNGNSFKDIEFQILRTCGDPDIIFDEDPLRILRLLRFHARLGFDIEKETVNGAVTNAHRLSIISQERITDEFTKILSSSRAACVLPIFDTMGILPIICGNADFVPTITKDKIAYISRVKNNPVLNLFLVFATGTKDGIEATLRAMKYPNEVINKVLFLKDATSVSMPSDDISIRRMMYNCKTAENFDDVLSCFEAFGFDVTYIVKKAIKPEFHKMLGYKLPINGNDIMEILNISGGPIIKTINDELIGIVFANPNITKEECIEYVKNRK